MRGIADGINRALAETRGVCVVLENVAGQARALLQAFNSVPVSHVAQLLCPVTWYAGLLDFSMFGAWLKGGMLASKCFDKLAGLSTPHCLDVL